VFALALLLPITAQAGVIYMNVSVKAILNPATGQPAPYVSEHLIDEFIRFGNLMLEKYHRGYRLRLVEFVEIGGSSHPHDPSTWYPFKKDANDNFLEEEFRKEAYDDYPVMYRWNFSSLNIFLTTGFGGGFCATCTGRPSDYIVNGSGQGALPSFTAEEVFAAHLLHEIGHYFGLAHTHGIHCEYLPPSTCNTPTGVDGDGLASTLPDVANSHGCACMNTIDDLAQLNFGENYSQLEPSEQADVENTWKNLMSYHERFGYAILTDEQLDLWTDVANDYRASFVTGHTWFVDWSGGCTIPTGSSACPNVNAAGGPYQTLAAGLAQANTAGGDIVLVRTGVYNVPGIINQAATIIPNRGNVVMTPQ
jgi:hypothetical protein